jgi:hypothetical protein
MKMKVPHESVQFAEIYTARQTSTSLNPTFLINSLLETGSMAVLAPNATRELQEPFMDKRTLKANTPVAAMDLPLLLGVRTNPLMIMRG